MSIKRLRKSLLCFLGLLVFQFCSGQELGKFDVVKGLDRYQLESPFIKSDTSLRFANGGRLEYKGRVEYTYLYEKAFTQPYNLAGVHFKNVLLTYESDRLIRIHFDQLYTSRIYPDFEQKARREFEMLYKYLKNQWNTTGKKKTYGKSLDDTDVAKGYQWKGKERVMKLIFHESKDTTPSYSIELVLELSGLE